MPCICESIFTSAAILVLTELARLRSTVAERPVSSLSSRFQTISQAVSKFVACHTKVLNVCASGRAPVDLEHDAVSLYESIPKNGVFKFMQCWYILRDSEKWGAWRSSNEKRHGNKRSATEAVVRGDSTSYNCSQSSTAEEADANNVQDEACEEQPKGSHERNWTV